MIEVAVTPSRLVAGRIETLRVQLVNLATRPCTNVILCLRLPTQIVLLGSSSQIEIPKLAPGEGITWDLRVKARKEGTFLLTSSGFSYRDGFGRSFHPEPASATLEVLPAQFLPATPIPLLAAGLITTELPLDSWALLEGWIENVGVVSVQSVELRIHLEGGETSKIIAGWRRPELLPGRREIFQIPVRAGQRGTHVPIRLIALYRDITGRSDNFIPPGIRVQVAEVPLSSRAGLAWPVRIFLAASEPTNAGPIRSGIEFRKIEEEFQKSANRDQFQLRYCLATQVRDLRGALLEFRPHILHFSGHGVEEGLLCFLNESGRESQVRTGGLANLFQLFSSDVKCVLLNACYSEQQAAEISQHIPYVVGMNDGIELDSAIAFSVGFYQVIAAGGGIEEAFALGCVAIETEGCRGREIPVLKRRS